MEQWLGKGKRIANWGPGAKNILFFPLTLLSFVFLMAVFLRVFLYRAGIFTTQKLNCKVVSVGNLTVGGTGKTPLILAMAKQFRDLGERVVVISRGYKGRKKEKITIASQGDGPLVSWEEVGEEPFLLADRCEGVPVLVGKNRYEVGRFALENFRPTVILLDDGFQHLKLFRDLNVLLIDCTAPFGNGYLLPRGPLREPLSHIKRASAIVFSRVSQSKNLQQIKQKIEPWIEEKPVFHLNFFPMGFVSIGTKKEEDLTLVKGKKILAVSGIGNPFNFHQTLLKLGPQEVLEKVFPDHYFYSRRDFKKILDAGKGMDCIITTEKDGVKLERFLGKGSSLWALRIEGRITEGEEWMDFLTKNNHGFE
jgi:tetraacyldisaccharide 4'-kinase